MDGGGGNIGARKCSDLSHLGVRVDGGIEIDPGRLGRDYDRAMRATVSVAALSAAVLVCMLPAQRTRQGAGRGGRGAWDYLAKTYDKNGDGRITLEEFGRGERGFRNLDRNGDGAITAEDRRARGGRRREGANAAGGRGPRFGSLRQFFDLYASFLNVDGKAGISPVDWSRYVQGLRADEDGVVSARELGAFLGASATRGMGRMASGRIGRLLDANRDGSVHIDELKGVIELLDQNEDGKVDADDGVPVPPAVGMKAPDFTLKRVDSKPSVTLSSFVGKQPVALIFGSYT